MKFPLAALVALCLAAPAAAQTPAAQAPAPQTPGPQVPTPLPVDAAEQAARGLRDRALRGSGAYDFVAELTTRFGPRLAGTASEQRAAEWTASRFRAMGFENVRVEPFALSVWRRGVERGEIVGAHAQPLTVTSLGGSPATPPQGLEGEVALFETWSDLLDAAPGSLNGKIAVLLQDTPRTQTGSGYGSGSPMRSQGPREAARRGAVAFMLRSLGTHDHRFAHTGATAQEPGVVPSFALSPPDAEQLRRVAGLGAPVRVRLTGLSPAPVEGRSQNVVGEVRGRERPEEVIVIGGHLDSWDLGTGAIDDGAGVAITAAALKLIRDMPTRPRRTIRMVAFGSEEVSQPAPRQGLAGARAYADSRRADLGRHVIASESDFGARAVYSLALPAGADPGLVRRATRTLAPLGILFDAAPATGGGPDITPLSQAGVPAFRLNQDGSDYFDTHHTADDVLDRIDPKQLDQNVAAWAALLWLIADSEVAFTRPAAR